MAKKEEGIVVEVEDQFAYLKAIRHSSCKNCGACPGDNATIIKALNKAKATEGDLVYFETNESAMVKSAFIVFILPLVLIFLGAWLVPYAAVNWMHITAGTIYAVSGGVLGLVLGVVLIQLANKYYGENTSNLPIVTTVKGKVIQG